MCTSRAASAAWLLAALLSGAAHADDARKNAPAPPEPGFLEFLGGVDGLAEVNPDYLAQANPTNPANPTAAPPTPPVKAPAPPQAPPPGAKNDE
ncbi:MAG TPA: hypothetical protein VGI91_07540 [Steroidobacteraceae bacterium]|jgi:hypothetical protein